MSINEPYFQRGVYAGRGATFLRLAVRGARECPNDGFALNAYTAQIMAAVSAEAFIDELAFQLASLSRCDKAPELSRIGMILQELEDSRVQVLSKYQIASQLLPGDPFDVGKEPLQSFNHLIKLRNHLAHPKMTDKPPGWFSYFVSNGLLAQSPNDQFILPVWSMQLENKRCATWACRATARIIVELIKRLREPCTEYGVPGVHQFLTSAWGWAESDPHLWSELNDSESCS